MGFTTLAVRPGMGICRNAIAKKKALASYVEKLRRAFPIANDAISVPISPDL